MIGEVGALHEQAVKQQQVDVGGQGGRRAGARQGCCNACAGCGRHRGVEGGEREGGFGDLQRQKGTAAVACVFVHASMHACTFILALIRCVRNSQILTQNVGCWVLSVGCPPPPQHPPRPSSRWDP